MRLPTLLATALLAIPTTAKPNDPPAGITYDNKYEKVKLDEPLNWIAGPRLFPADVIAGYNAPEGKYKDADSWADYVLEQCKQFSACTSTSSYKAENSGSSGGVFWFGYVFRGGPTMEDDFVRNDAVTDSVAYTVADDDGSSEKGDQVVIEL